AWGTDAHNGSGLQGCQADPGSCRVRTRIGRRFFTRVYATPGRIDRPDVISLIWDFTTWSSTRIAGDPGWHRPHGFPPYPTSRIIDAAFRGGTSWIRFAQRWTPPPLVCRKPDFSPTATALCGIRG